MAALAPLLGGYLILVLLLVLVTATAPGASFSLGVAFAAAGPAWLAACHVPLTIQGAPLGVLPLLLLALVIAVAALAARRAATTLRLSRPADAWPVVVTIGAAHAVAGAVIAASVAGTATAAGAAAFFICGVVGLAGGVVGTARRCGLPAAALARAGDLVRLGLRSGLLGLAALVAAGAAAYALGMLGALSQAAGAFQQVAPGAGSAFGLLLLCLVYLPNALLGGLSFVVGSGVTIGGAAVSPLNVHAGPVPAFPLLAAVPDHFAPWWPLLFVLPLACGVAVGMAVRRWVTGLVSRLRVTGIAGLVVAVALLVLAALASGDLGGGAFGPVTVPAGLLAVLGFCWIAVPGALVCWLGDAWYRKRVGFVTAEPPDGDRAEYTDDDEEWYSEEEGQPESRDPDTVIDSPAP